MLGPDSAFDHTKARQGLIKTCFLLVEVIDRSMVAFCDFALKRRAYVLELFVIRAYCSQQHIYVC